MACLIELLSCQPILHLGFFDFACANRFVDTPQLSSQRRLDRSTPESLNVILPEAFLGSFCVWHGECY